jgi:hypothetical protein
MAQAQIRSRDFNFLVYLKLSTQQIIINVVQSYFGDHFVVSLHSHVHAPPQMRLGLDMLKKNFHKF